MKPEDPDLVDAPAPVQEAAAFLSRHRVHRLAASWGMFGAILSGLIATSALHDVYGWSEAAAASPLLASVLVVAAIAVWVARGPLKGAAEKQALVARYRALQAMGLPLTAPDSERDEDRSAVDRLTDRILALAGEREAVRSAAVQARERARSLEQELAHLDRAMADDPALSAQLAGVRERVDGEVSRIRARLAETWAALIEPEGAAEDALEDALMRLRADAEVEGAETRRRRAQARSQGARS